MVSDNIKIRLVNCAYTALSLPVAYPTPQNYFVLDVDVTTDLEYVFTQTTSDFIECRSITMKQSTANPPSVPLAYPGTANSDLTTQDAITNLYAGKGVYKVADTHKPHVIKFYINS